MGDLARQLAIRNMDQKNSSLVERMDNKACIEAYSVPFQTTHGNVVLVSDSVATGSMGTISANYTNQAFVQQQFRQDILDYDTMEVARENTPWLLRNWVSDLGQDVPSGTTFDYLQQHPDHLAIFGDVVKYCLAEQIEEKCKLFFNLELAVLIIVLNFLKAGVIAYALFSIKEKPLVTIGDAVASFLQTPDPTTLQMCLRNKSDFRDDPPSWSEDPVEYKRTPRSWRMAVSKSSQVWFCIW
jgi:hypothetical protein